MKKLFKKGNKFGIKFPDGHGYSFIHGLSSHPRYNQVKATLYNKGFKWSQLTLEQKKEMLNA